MTTTTPARYEPTKRICLPSFGSTHRRSSMQLFPWTTDSAEQLFNAKWRASEHWASMVAEFSDVLAVADGQSLYILHTNPKPPLSFRLNSTFSEDKPQIAFALRTARPFDPLVVAADNRRIFVLDIRHRKFLGYLRGHGGRITSIAVHPTSPNIFATTSSDFTTRIYNLDLKVHSVGDPAENPAWPPWDGPSHGSAAHGTDGSDSTGSGFGRCVQILVGGRSGGHSWDVLGAAFHPHLPLIATCGADRSVKIWRILSNRTGTVVRDDKPLFSARITTSRVLSIAWLGEDVLLMHTATTCTPIRNGTDHPDADEEDDPDEPSSDIEPGTIDVFQWLGFRRFFPTNEHTPDPALQGGISDYQESKSYTLLSTRPLPQTPPEPISNISQPQTPGLHGRFLLVHPHSMEIVLLNISDLKARTLPSNISSDNIVEMTKRIRLDESAEPRFSSPSTSARGTPPATQLFDADLESDFQIAACALAPSGAVIILSSKGTIWFLDQRAS
ncbi:WD40-repeat-containing domain protein [Mycena capillaripes]|nr:WD40-repeat-containing domain protein [Mycena capillaripes]